MNATCINTYLVHIIINIMHTLYFIHVHTQNNYHADIHNGHSISTSTRVLTTRVLLAAANSGVGTS